MIKRYKKKPVVIEAVQYKDNNYQEILDFIGSEWPTPMLEHPAGAFGNWGDDRNEWLSIGIWIKTLEGTMTAAPDDYVIKGVNGEFYPCKPDIFEKSYEEVIDG